MFTLKQTKIEQKLDQNSSKLVITLRRKDLYDSGTPVAATNIRINDE